MSYTFSVNTKNTFARQASKQPVNVHMLQVLYTLFTWLFNTNSLFCLIYVGCKNLPFCKGKKILKWGPKHKKNKNQSPFASQSQQNRLCCLWVRVWLQCKGLDKRQATTLPWTVSLWGRICKHKDRLTLDPWSHFSKINLLSSPRPKLRHAAKQDKSMTWSSSAGLEACLALTRPEA